MTEPQLDGTLLVHELAEWLSNSGALADNHITGYVAVPEWRTLFKPGPIPVLPRVVRWSLLVFKEATRLVRSVPERQVDLYIELRWGRLPLRNIPRTPAQLDRMLSVTPPSLTVYDAAHSFGNRARWPVSQIVELNSGRLFGAGSFADLDPQIHTYFAEFVLNRHYPRYVVCTTERISARSRARVSE